MCKAIAGDTGIGTFDGHSCAACCRQERGVDVPVDVIVLLLMKSSACLLGFRVQGTRLFVG